MIFKVLVWLSQIAPVAVGGSEDQLKKYLGRMVEEPLMAVSV